MFSRRACRNVVPPPPRAPGARRLRGPRAQSDWFAALLLSERGEAVDPETLAAVL